MVSLRFGLLLLLVSCEGPSALQWTHLSRGQGQIVACDGSDATFPWTFSLDAGEQVEDIKWLYAPPGQGSPPDLMANYLYGQFIPVGAFQNRVRHLGNGSLELSKISHKDAGEYIIEVGTHKGGEFFTVRQSADLVVGEPPSQEQLTISMTDHAVYDNSTDQFHVQLACGRLSSLGQPPVTVIWKTPSGEVGSTYSDHGTFFLLAPNPFKGGNYSCRVSAGACLPSNYSAQIASTVVKGTDARLLLLEAKGDSLKEENNKLKAELNHTLSVLTNENNQLKKDLNNTMTSLTQQNQLLNGQLQSSNTSLQTMGNQLKLELRLTEDLLNNVKNSVTNLKGELNVVSNNLTGRVDGLYSKLQTSQGRNVSFHAKLSGAGPLPRTSHVVFNSVVTNEGSAYNMHTGKFTTPLSGTYFFAFTVTPDGGHRALGLDCKLMVDQQPITSVSLKNEYMATGHAVLRLQPGQKVWVMFAGGSEHAFLANELSFFSGFLISPDL